MPDEMTARLLSTTDAMVWAQEFCGLFDVTHTGCSPAEGDDSVGLMVGWFANAMCVAKDQAMKPLREAIYAAMNELGVPTDDYPAPVANAINILGRALHGEGWPEVSGRG